MKSNKIVIKKSNKKLLYWVKVLYHLNLKDFFNKNYLQFVMESQINKRKLKDWKLKMTLKGS